MNHGQAQYRPASKSGWKYYVHPVATLHYPCSAGQLSPLINDPLLKTIGMGTNIFLGGTVGYITWNGTQFNTEQIVNEKNVPIGPARTISVIGNLKNMSTNYMKSIYILNYGVTMLVGLGIPIPIINEEIASYVSIRNSEILTKLVDYSCDTLPRRIVDEISYQQLMNGTLKINGKNTYTSSMSNIGKAREIAQKMKTMISSGIIKIQEPIVDFPQYAKVKFLN